MLPLRLREGVPARDDGREPLIGIGSGFDEDAEEEVEVVKDDAG